MNNWKEFNISDLLQIEYGKSLQNYRSGAGMYEVFGTNGKIGLTNKYLFEEPSIIIGRKGAYREVHIAKKPAYVIDTAFYTKKRNEKTDTTFMYFWFKNIDINAMDSGSAIPSTSRDELYELSIKLPSLPEQIAIAEILTCFDNKIDLLHRQNETLEALAEMLFRQWFVEEADESWERKSLNSIAHYLNGLALQKFPVKDEINSLPVIKIRELKQGVTSSTDKCSNNLPEQFIVKDGDILFSWSGSLEVVIWHDGTGALNQHLFKVTSEKFPKWFYYLATKYHLPEFKNIAHTKSTTMGHIQRHHLTESQISIPPNDVFQSHDETIAPIIEKIIKNNAQIKTLTQLRETLLPKLMSGEVRVAEVQEHKLSEL